MSSTKGMEVLMGSLRPLTESDWRELAAVRLGHLQSLLNFLKYRPFGELINERLEGNFTVENAGSCSRESDYHQDLLTYVIEGSLGAVRNTGDHNEDLYYFALTKEGQWILWIGKIRENDFAPGSPDSFTWVQIKKNFPLDKLYELSGMADLPGVTGERICSLVESIVWTWKDRLERAQIQLERMEKSIRLENQLLHARGYRQFGPYLILVEEDQ